MAYLADRVLDTTATTGTGAVTLDDVAAVGYQTFATAFGSSGLVVSYCIELGTEWEVGDGTFNGTTGLTRDVVRASSNSGNLVNFSAGPKRVFCTATAATVKNSVGGRILAVSNGWNLP